MIKNELTRLFHHSAGKLISQGRELVQADSLSTLQDGVYQVSKYPPYISQLAGADKSKMEGFYQPIHDPAAAKRFGTDSLADFSQWAWRSCGIVGVEMVLKAQLEDGFKKTTMDLVKEAQAMGGYETNHDQGWKHQGLVNLAAKYGVNGWLEKFVSPNQIAKHILANRYVLASIVGERGGHLLLVYGINLENGKVKSFLVQDPNNFKEKGEAKEITTPKFNQLSTRRVIVFESRGEKNDSNQ